MGFFDNIGKSLSNFGNSLVSGIGGAVTSGISGMFGNAIGGMVGDLFGFESDAEKANKLNAQLTRETNEQNYQIWQEQKQHEIDMWNMNNEYNTPEQQVARLREAGLNPYLAMSGGASAGNATSAPGSGQPPTMQTPQMQYESSWLQGLRSMGQALSNQGVQIDNDNKQESYDLHFANLKQQTELLEQQVELAKKDGKYKDIINDYLPQIQQETWEQLHNANYMSRVLKKYADEKVDSSEGITAVDQETMLEAMDDFSNMKKNMMILNNKLSSVCAAVNAMSAQYRVSRFARA